MQSENVINRKYILLYASIMSANIIIGGRYHTVLCITEGMTKINEHARSRVLEKLIYEY
jgi:hypothetical protein